MKNYRISQVHPKHLSQKLDAVNAKNCNEINWIGLVKYVNRTKTNLNEILKKVMYEKFRLAGKQQTNKIGGIK